MTVDAPPGGDVLILSKWQAGAVRLLAERIRERGWRRVLLTPETNDRNVSLVDEVIIVDWDTDDLDRVIAAIGAAGVQPVGIVNLMDVLMGWQINLARRYDVLGPAAAFGDLVDKATTRQLLHDLSLTKVRHAVCSAGEESTWSDFPAVVKPATQSGGSALVNVVHDPAQLHAALRGIADAYGQQAPALIEQHVRGKEFSVDATVVDNRVNPVLVAEKLDMADEQTRDSGLLITPPETPAVAAASAELAKMLQVLANRLDLCNGWLHVEARATYHGAEIIEINPRSGGNMYSAAIHNRIRVDPLAYQVDQFLPGGPPPIDPPEQVNPARLGQVPLDTMESGNVVVDFTREDLLTIPGVLDANVFYDFVAVGPERENIFASVLIGGDGLASLRAIERSVREFATFRVEPPKAVTAETTTEETT